MTATRFGRAAIERFLDAAASRLEGEWLLVGGAAAATWFDAGRTTEDIDLVGLAGTRDERLDLMDLAEVEGLPLEAVNSAAGFFLRKIDGWRDQLVPLRRDRATIHRPTPALFLLLKIGRLSATDLEDCLRLLEHCRASGEPVDVDRVLQALGSLPPTLDQALQRRRGGLAAALRALASA